MENEINTHPFPPLIPENATHLILGSFPTHKRNWRFNSYYPGRANFFWRMLSEIYQHPFEYKEGEDAARERIALCRQKGIAISDTIHKCQRKVATSSKDSDLIVIKKMDILGILKKNPTIRTVILTGSSGEVSAHRVFFEHLKERRVSYEVIGAKPPITGSFSFNERQINTYTLYSTSGINIGRYKEALAQYIKVLPQPD